MRNSIPPEIKDYLAVDTISPSGLTWINVSHCANSVISVGDCAGYLDTTTSPSYYKVVFKSVTYKTHRIVWYLETGIDPSDLDIDHIDRDTKNNAFKNLRLVDRSENMNNRSRWGSTNYRGVYFNKTDFTYSARIVHNGKHVYLGTFANEKDAALAWDYAALQISEINKILNFPNASYVERKEASESRIRQRGVLHEGKVLKGVSYDKSRKKYQSFIKIDSKMISLGRYLTAVEAAKIRDAELRKRGITGVDFNFD